MKINCSGKDCLNFFETSEPCSPSVVYTCRDHTPKTKLKIRFQSYQFDKQLNKIGNPIGTGHIGNQGEVGSPVKEKKVIEDELIERIDYFKND